MPNLSRRHALAGGISVSAIAAFGCMAGDAANAAQPLAGAQAPGWYRYKIGDIEVTVVTDGTGRFRFADTHVSNKSREEVNAGLAAAFYPPDMMATPYNPVVINTGAKLVAIDPGVGEAAFATSKGASGQFQANLKAAGIDRGAIDIVLISHFHGDHINGILDASGQLAFPKAEVLVPSVEWKYFMDDGEMSRAPAGRMQDVFKNARRVFDAIGRKVTQYEAGKDVIAGIAAVATPGHTPGHVSHVVSSGKASVYVQADVTHVPHLFARNPGWHAFYDQDGPMAEATRRKVYDMLAAERMPVQGFHYPFPSLAHVEKTATGYREVAMPWNTAL